MSDDSFMDQFAGLLSEEQAMSFLQNLDEEQVSKMVGFVIEEFIGPQLVKIRNNAQSYDSRKQVRKEYENMSEDERNKRFHNAVAEVRKVAVQIRQEPQVGFTNLQNKIRNPWYHEALLLIFDAEPDPNEPSQKEFATYMGRWIMMGLVPEMYTEQEARDLINEIFDDMSYEEALSKANRERLR